MRTRSLRLLAVAATVLAAVACSDDSTEVRAGDDTTTTTIDDATSTTEPARTVPARPADIRGTVTSVAAFEPITEDCTPPDELDPDGAVSSDDPPVCSDPDTDLLGTALVVEVPDGPGGRRISFAVTTATVLTGPGLRSFDDLRDGLVVEAWTSGPCAESYPEQCGAAAIRSVG